MIQHKMEVSHRIDLTPSQRRVGKGHKAVPTRF